MIKNELTTLPWEVGRLTNLRVLDLDMERYTCPPITVSKRGGKEIQRYFDSLLRGQQDSRMNLEQFDLVVIPKEVLAIHGLAQLVLAHNELEALPASMVEFTRLEALNVDKNPHLRDLPRTMRHMMSLRAFSMAGNDLKTVPDEIFRLTNLTSLNFSHNKIEGIGNLICNLSQLMHLDLSHNSLWSVPWPAMMQLIYLEKLELQGNPLTFLPSSIADLTNLTHIDLGGTQLKMLPADMIDMMNLKFLNLEEVDLQVFCACVYLRGCTWRSKTHKRYWIA